MKVAKVLGFKPNPNANAQEVEAPAARRRGTRGAVGVAWRGGAAAKALRIPRSTSTTAGPARSALRRSDRTKRPRELRPRPCVVPCGVRRCGLGCVARSPFGLYPYCADNG